MKKRWIITILCFCILLLMYVMTKPVNAETIRQSDDSERLIFELNEDGNSIS